MKTSALLVLFFSFIVGLGGCKTENYIVGSDGFKYYLISEEVEPSEKNGWMGKLAFYRKEGDDTIHIIVSEGPPVVFKDIHIPIE
jgi:hypothetical protein